MSSRDTALEQKFLVERLNKIPFFNSISDHQLSTLLDIGEIRHYKKDETILPENSAKKNIFVLLKGEVSLQKEGKQLILLKNTGDIFGEIGFISKDRQVSATAKDSTSCYVVDTALIETKHDSEKNITEAHLHRFLAETLAGRIKSIQFENIVLHQEVIELRRVIKRTAKHQKP